MRRTIAILFTSAALAAPAISSAQTAQAPAAAPAATAAPPPADCPEMARALTSLLGRDGRMSDWAQLARYRGNNAQVLASGEQVDVVFLGDSITDGWDNEHFTNYFPGKHYINRGISGQTTAQMLVRLMPDVLALKPRAIVLLAGTNDIAGNTGPTTNDDIQRNIEAISELAASRGIRMVLSSVLPVSNYHAKPETGPAQTVRRPIARIAALNDWLRSYAAAHNHVYLDYVPATSDASGLLKAELSLDDLHPTADGYKIMTPLAQAAIDKAIAKQ